MIIVDAAALLEVLLQTRDAKVVEERVFDPQETLHTLYLLDIEVAQVIRRYAANGEVDGERAATVLRPPRCLSLAPIPP